jgi:hypothetical protein
MPIALALPPTVLLARPITRAVEVTPEPLMVVYHACNGKQCAKGLDGS